jgi:hypothetical protein
MNNLTIYCIAGCCIFFVYFIMKIHSKYKLTKDTLFETTCNCNLINRIGNKIDDIYKDDDDIRVRLKYAYMNAVFRIRSNPETNALLFKFVYQYRMKNIKNMENKTELSDEDVLDFVKMIINIDKELEPIDAIYP